MNIAVICYYTKHGTDVVFARTRHKPAAPFLSVVRVDLPPITNGLLNAIGVPDPDVEGEDATEEAWYYGVYSPEQFASFPVIEDLDPEAIAVGALAGESQQEDEEEL